MDTKNVWKFIEEQYERCKGRMDTGSYKDAIDLIYDIAGNISNLYLYLEEGRMSTDKGRILNNLSAMFRNGVFRQDYGLILREKWNLRNIAKYGFFASKRIEIKSIEIPEAEISGLFRVLENMFSEFRNYLEAKHAE